MDPTPIEVRNARIMLLQDDTPFKRCMQELLEIYSWKDIFDQSEIDRPPLIKWSSHPNRRGICRTLKLKEDYEYKDSMGPIRAVLEKHFHLYVIRKRDNHKKGAQPTYFIGEEEQQELYQLLRNKYHDKGIGDILKNMEENGSFIVDPSFNPSPETIQEEEQGEEKEEQGEEKEGEEGKEKGVQEEKEEDL